MSIPYHKKSDFLNCLLFSGTMLFIILRVIFSSGNLSPDSIEYFLQAKNFWHYKTDFSLGFPFLIKIFSFLTGGEFIASKLINILSYVAIIIFSYSKKFFFPQTLLVFSFYPFLPFYTASLSEPLYFLVNYVIIYHIYKLISEGYSLRRTVALGLLFFALVSVRFAGVFVFISSIAFFSYFTLIHKYPLKPFLLLLLLTTAGVSFYLLINYFYCGYFFGNRNHLHIEQHSFIGFISTIVPASLKDFSFLNVILHKGIWSRLSFLNIWVSLSVLIITLAVIIRKPLNYFDTYLLFSFLIVFAWIMYSYYTTKIDNSVRIKSSAYLYLLLFLILNMKLKYINIFKLFTIFILCLNIFTLVKYYEPILGYSKKFSSLICEPNTENVGIVYKDYKTERVKPKVLMFKTFLIENGYKIIENKDSAQYKKPSDCYIETDKIMN